MKKLMLAKGDCVRAKKWSGETFLGIYQYTYLDGSHCVNQGKQRFNIKPNDIELATDEEAKEFKKKMKEETPLPNNDKTLTEEMNALTEEAE